MADVEVAVADYWSRILLPQSRITAIREQVMAALAGRQRTGCTSAHRPTSADSPTKPPSPGS